MLMEMYTMVSGKMTKLMDMVYTITLMELAMKAGGLKTNNTVKGKRSGRIMHVTKANTKTAKSMDTVNFYGRTGQLTPETL